MKKKKCSFCKELKPYEEYSKSKSSKSGLQYICKKCAIEYRKTYKDLVNTYEKDSVEYEIFNYFSKMNIYLSDEQMKYIVQKLTKNAYNDFFKTLDELQDKYGADASLYKDNLLEELKMDRYLAQRHHINSHVGNKASIRSVRQLSKDGEYIATHNSISDASEAITGSRTRAVGSISHCASGKFEQSFGFVWEYVETNDYWDE